MIGGITPVDNAYEIIGVQQCSLLLKHIFIETMAGKAVFVTGFLCSIVRSLRNGSFRAMIIFLGIFFSSLFLFIIPTSSVRPSRSSMEEFGYSKVTTEFILRKAGIEMVTVNPVIFLMGQVVSGVSKEAISLIDTIATRHSQFLRDPFLSSKLWLLGRDRLNQGVNNEILHERLICFYQDRYFPVLRKLKEGGSDIGRDLWPGADPVLALYSSQAANEWRELESDLYKLINIDGLFQRISRDYYNGSSIQSAAVRALINGDVAHAPWAFSALRISGQENALSGAWIDQKPLFNGFWDQIVRLWMSGFPALYGLCLWSVWAAFPFVLVFMSLSADVNCFGVFLKFLLAMKLIPLFWVLLDKGASLLFDIQVSMAGGAVWLWNMTLVGVIPMMGVAALLMPLLILVNRKGRI
ncbi:MAG: hypothetical protein HQL19_01095 [Candidatus Omnitrophica bacterium]|nr:hypothetical protein [Candidatus Omnitrophota bacterium]